MYFLKKKTGFYKFREHFPIQKYISIKYFHYKITQEHSGGAGRRSSLRSNILSNKNPWPTCKDYSPMTVSSCTSMISSDTSIKF